MNRRFTFLCTRDDRKKLEELAAYFRRSQGDTVRQLIQWAFENNQIHSGELMSQERVNYESIGLSNNFIPPSLMKTENIKTHIETMSNKGKPRNQGKSL